MGRRLATLAGYDQSAEGTHSINDSLRRTEHSDSALLLRNSNRLKSRLYNSIPRPASHPDRRPQDTIALAQQPLSQNPRLHHYFLMKAVGRQIRLVSCHQPSASIAAPTQD